MQISKQNEMQIIIGGEINLCQVSNVTVFRAIETHASSIKLL